jgi:hypothetical protein
MSPVGTSEDSPPFQRRGRCGKRLRPVGTSECHRRRMELFQACLRHDRPLPHPPLKWRAIIIRSLRDLAGCVPRRALENSPALQVGQQEDFRRNMLSVVIHLVRAETLPTLLATEPKKTMPRRCADAEIAKPPRAENFWKEKGLIPYRPECEAHGGPHTVHPPRLDARAMPDARESGGCARCQSGLPAS